MSVPDTIKSTEQAAIMEAGQASLGASRSSDSDAVQPDQEKTADVALAQLDTVVEPDPSHQVTKNASAGRTRPRLLEVVESKDFKKHQAHVRQQNVQWSKALEHVKELLKNEELGKKQDLLIGKDQPSSSSPKKPLQRSDTGFSQAHEIPGQLPGYPELSEFLGSDERWMMCRRFGRLQARLFLEKQDEIKELQEEIDQFDLDDFRKADDSDDPMQNFRLFTRRRYDDDEKKARKELFKRANEQYKEYADLVNAIRSMNCFEKPARYERITVGDYVERTGPTRPSEFKWIYKNDLVTLRGPRENATMGAFLETQVNKLRQHFPRLANFVRINPEAWLEGNRAAERLAGWGVMGFLVLLIPVMFVVPIYALYKIGDNIAKSIGVLLSFALLFMLILNGSTPAKPHEVLSGSAAYLAVLVVFFGSLNPGNGSGSSASPG